MKRIFILLSALLMTLSLSAQVERSIFSLTLNPTPSLDDRIVIGQVGSLSENMTMQQFIDFTTTNLDVYSKSQIDIFFANYLAKDNLVVYTPTLDYHPATKKYVDDGNDTGYLTMTRVSNNIQSSDFTMKIRKKGKVVHLTGTYKKSNQLTTNEVAFRISLASIGADALPSITVYSNPIVALEASDNRGESFYIQQASGSETDLNVRVRFSNGSSDQAVKTIDMSYICD